MEAQYWTVVGGADKGGIVVRTGRALSSTQCPDRLSTGALVKELGLEGDRLHYERVSGTGPGTGWVSVKLKDKGLLFRKDERFKVVFAPRVAIRETPRADADVLGTVEEDDIVVAESRSEDGSWIRVAKGGWILITHPEHGRLLSPVLAESKAPQTLKKSWDVEFKFKGCGANVTALAGGTAGASRDALFDHLLEQHLQANLRADFREAIPLHLYDTGITNEADIVAYFQTAGHIEPDDRKRHASPEGVRQHVEAFGGCRCIVLELDKAVPLRGVVVLAHGYRVQGDDLYGLAHHLVRPGFRFVLPQAPLEIPAAKDDEEEDEWRRPLRQWWLPARGQRGAEEAGKALALCANAAVAQAQVQTLVLGGFSQGAATSMAAAVSRGALDMTPAAMVLLAPPAWSSPLPKASLDGVVVFATCGAADEVNPISGCEQVLAACGDAGANARPLKRCTGGHEVTIEAVKAVVKCLDSLFVD